MRDCKRSKLIEKPKKTRGERYREKVTDLNVYSKREKEIVRERTRERTRERYREYDIYI